jgi:hypothetical protein
MRKFFTSRLNRYKDSIEFLSEMEEFLLYKKDKEKKKKQIRKQFNETLNEMRALLK